jgi:MFS family permease
VLADRFGSLPVLTVGYALGALTAALIALAFWFQTASAQLLVAVFFVAGLYVAVQEALESTVTADMVSADTLTMSYGALGTVNGAAKFASSAAVGLLWTAASPVVGLGLAAALMVAGTVALARLPTR